MTRNKKVALGVVTTLLVAAPIAAVTSCGNNYTEGDVFFVSDGGSIYDKSFNQQGAASVAAILNKKRLDTGDYYVPKGHDSGSLYTGYEVAANVSKKIVVGTGFLHQPPVENWVKMHGSFLKFILADVQVDKNNDAFKGNVAGISYKTKQSGFLAGYLSAQYLVEIKKDTTPTLGTFGGGNFPAVTDFMVGFVLGGKYYNDKHPDLKNKVKFATFAKEIDYTNSGFQLNKGQSKATRLVEEGADVILPVAGPQTADVIDVIKNKTGKFVIGVDTDQKLKFPGYENLFITSITKNIKESVIAVYNKVTGKKAKSWTKGYGDTTWGTIENKLTGIAKPGMVNAEVIYNKIINDVSLLKSIPNRVKDQNWDDALKIIKSLKR
ncbi:BMP family ABC transporter substrate-binding protein [Mycoplasma marinum]|uniref:ABC transporter substrate-binding protein PnrA-like domain-containing protein n=1 Tax=Mycoplasma marinum TaxID=1937190 RepID=A0A4V2NI88_9MOLU|nr:BMP family ABC transporter substrate-binding protein [Mycoplasma marinum]TCG11428.1 hypothetical protein C4B24_02035 [Mycoplasma marinum]